MYKLFLSIIWLLFYIYGLLVPSYYLPKKLYEPVINTLKNTTQNLASLIFDINLHENTDIKFENDSKIDIILCNHINYFDSFILTAILKNYSINKFNFIYNSDTTLVPGIGLALYCSTDIKIHKKDWNDDKNMLSKQLNDLATAKKQVLIIFPEGSYFNDKLKKKAQEFAKQNNLEPLDNLLIPRAKGIYHLINSLKNINKMGKLWECTLISTKKATNAIFGEIEIPLTDNYEVFKNWLYNLWYQKDLVIKDHKLLNYEKIETESTPEFYILLLMVFLFGLELLFSKYGRYYLLANFMIGYFIVIKGLLFT